jgi:putative transcriptional regulator
VHQNWCKGPKNGQIDHFLVCLVRQLPSRATVIRYKLKELIAQKSFVEDRRVTLDEVAEATGISRNTLSRIANTRGYGTTTAVIDKLCGFFDCEISALMERVASIDDSKSK